MGTDREVHQAGGQRHKTKDLGDRAEDFLCLSSCEYHNAEGGTIGFDFMNC